MKYTDSEAYLRTTDHYMSARNALSFLTDDNLVRITEVASTPAGQLAIRDEKRDRGMSID